MATQFPAGPAAGEFFTTGAGDTYQFLNNRWVLSPNPDIDPSFDVYSRINSSKWGSNAIIYENIFDAIANKTIREFGGLWSDKTTYSSTLWNNANIIKLNSTTVDPQVASTAITVQPGYSMVWVRVLNDESREIHLDLYFDESDANGGPVASTYCDEEIHYGNNWFPERMSPYNSSIGSQIDNYQHLWIPMSLPNANGGTAYLVARNHSTSTPDYWISGLALTANPWGYSQINHITAHRGLRITSVGLTNAERPDWYGGYEGTTLVSRSLSTTSSSVGMRMTVVNNSGDDKVIHVVGCGDDGHGRRAQLPMFVNGTKVSAMPAALDPFVWHILNNNAELRVTSYLVPSALAYANGNHMKIEFTSRGNSATWYLVQMICCDLRA